MEQVIAFIGTQKLAAVSIIKVVEHVDERVHIRAAEVVVGDVIEEALKVV